MENIITLYDASKEIVTFVSALLIKHYAMKSQGGVDI
jgi:hypothetical protein